MSQYVSARRSFNGLTRVDMEDYFDDMELENLYQWIDRIPLTRPKKNLAKDFSDGVLVAELIKYYFPRMVDLHNYTPAHSSKQKQENWYLLNRVLQNLDLDLSEDVIRALSNAKAKVVEKVLMMLRNQIDKGLERHNAIKQRTKQLHAFHSKGKTEEILDILTSRSPTQNETERYSESPMRGVVPHGHPARANSRSKTGSTYGDLTSRAYSTIRPALPMLSPPIDNVAKSMLEERELESMAKDETIRILNAKLKRLEHLLHLKDLRIEDLESCFNAASSLRILQLDDM
ncbi:sperm flagellar protein 1-like isoform X2 [Littorina saxatilis]|uniref:sperm flagellar protein 1-like isoform X2 n=1 Tax=Littorina saxatilis TaxID=31220 RepID=UPI0038B685FF